MNIEQKYVFIELERDMIVHWIEHACIPDPVYHAGVVSSIYYDTPRFDHYFEKRNSDYIKSKVRLRWYQNIEKNGEPFDVPCFVEMKRKTGVGRHKERKKILISSVRLCDDPFSDEELLRIPAVAYELDYIPPGLLIPMLLIQYDRRRYVDPHSGSRLAVDTNIRCVRANPAYISGLPPVHLALGVLEIKGEGRELPDSLNPISARLTREAFSKYARCFEHLMQPFGRRQ